MNALEMLELTKTQSTLRNDCLSLLENLQNADGGWGFHTGEQSRVEPTSWALRALFDSAKTVGAKNFRSATAFLRSRQLPDGSWPACAEMKAGSWITSLTCSALAADPESAKNMAAGLKWLCDDFPRDSSPWRRFVRRIRNESRLAKQNDAYRGWGWTPKTSSWVEPTAFALMALRDAPAAHLPENAAQRRELAVALLYDRMCPGGGWNCGNPSVYGVDGEALVLPTCWALLALREAQEKPGRALSLAWLQKEFAKIESAASLAVARMTLECYGIERQASSEIERQASPDIVTPPAKRDLQNWTAQELAEQGTHVLAWTSMALNPGRPWPAVAAKSMTGNVMGGVR